MEFDSNINRFFRNPITKFKGQDIARSDPELWKMVDYVGEASRVAQNLHRPVTVAHSFANSNQTLYIMTDSSANKGNGAVLGMLKIGPKKLFLLDRKGQQNELEPLCVLDFYIHESCQRMGLGKVLFTHFLEDENIHVDKIAIDRPSEKFLGFLRKHYGLVDFIPQVNNFVIYEGFFDNCDRQASNKPSTCNTNSSSLSSRCNSMIALNSASGQSINFRTRSRQSVTECFYHEPECNQNDLWRTNSLVNVSRSPTAQISVQNQPKPFATETASKFGHHRLW
ncbi:alpha-tubulin N-acetyltransferase 1-like isoform X1 [Daphnia carinata]|uniref:alpha-tubulin N-acetyltransferase 1-like isoform X1 n=1 Tax=Daphnia carinata TaxID=120202 RepID=UPI00257DE175|nr:alpha-tubulin N-acetyltransferase 1-like isoform X1 [Daphnia carinata]